MTIVDATAHVGFPAIRVGDETANAGSWMFWDGPQILRCQVWPGESLLPNSLQQ